MSLQKFVVICLVASVGILVHATVVLAQSRSLHDVMKDMGRTLSGIARPVNQGTAGANELVLSQKLVQLVGEAILIPPSGLQDAGLLRYQALMSELNLAAIELEAALAASDLPRAQAAVRLLGSIRGTGHDEFKE
jgi:hypothetical protein